MSSIPIPKPITTNRDFELQIHQGLPDPSFWKSYEALWKDSSQSPFQSPDLLKTFSQRAKNNTYVVAGYLADQLYGAVFLEKKGETSYFLSDQKNDFNSFVFHQKANKAFFKTFFRHFLSTVRQSGWTLVFNNQPTWESYWPVFQNALASEKLYHKTIPYSVCRVLEATDGQALYDQIHGSRELRYRVNRLIKQQDATFEALEDDEDLEVWVDEFCRCHVERWATTNTKSKYEDPVQRDFFRDCLQAWIKAKILVRFAVKVQEKRIGFVVGLRQDKKMIHHATTYDLSFRKYSPGKALTHFMAEWMRDRDLNSLDFGYGNESYKKEVTNKENRLSRVFMSSKTRLPFILKTEFVATIKQHPKVYAFYINNIKPLREKV